MAQADFVLALIGGPRKGGNSETLLEAFLEPAAAAGLALERLRVPDLEVKACRGCRWCEGRGECVQKDRMQEAYPKLLAARQVVIATPVFFYNFPGQTKIFIDRTQALWSRKYRPAGGAEGPVPISSPGRKGYLIASGATKGRNLFKGLEWTARYFFDAIDVSFEGLYAVRGLEARDDAAKDEAALEGARTAGAAFFGSGPAAGGPAGEPASRPGIHD